MPTRRATSRVVVPLKPRLLNRSAATPRMWARRSSAGKRRAGTVLSGWTLISKYLLTDRPEHVNGEVAAALPRVPARPALELQARRWDLGERYLERLETYWRESTSPPHGDT